MRQQVIDLVQNVKVAGTVAGGTTATSVFDLLQGGVSIFAITAGAVLSITLIIIHLMRWRSDKRESEMRYKILKLEKESLEKEKEESTSWPYRQD